MARTSGGAARAGLGYLPALDGLRAVALVAVLCFHAGFGWMRGGYLPLTSFFVLSGFLITALLLVEHQRHGAIGIRRFWGRRVRRLFPAAAVGVVLAGVFAATAGTSDQVVNLRADVVAAFANVANWRFVFAGQVYDDLFAQPSPLQHFWSLAVEEQFYLVFPLLVAGLLAVARGRRWALAAGLVAGAIGSTLLMRALHQPGDAPLRVYFGTDTRAAEILVGALLALVLVGDTGLRPLRRQAAKWLDVAALGALAVSVVLWCRASEFDPRLYEGGLVMIALLAAVVVAACTLPDSTTARILGARPLAALGRISYGVYIFHWPLFLWLTEERTGLRTVPLFGLRMAVTLALAIACYRLIEQPVRTGRALRWPVAPAAWANATVAAVAIVALATVPTAATARDDAELAFRTDGDTLPQGPAPALPPASSAPATVADSTVPAPTGTTPGSAAGPATSAAAGPVPPSPAATAAPVPRAETPPPQELPRGPAPTAPPPTTVPAASAPTTAPPPPPPVRVMVVGDSLAQNLATGLTTWAEKSGSMVVWDLSLRGCTLSRGGVRRLSDGSDWPVHPTCGWWATEGETRVVEFQPDVVLIQTGHGEIFDRSLPEWDEFRRPGDPRFDSWLLSEYQAAVDVLGSTGATVVWSLPACIDADRKPGFIDNREGNDRLRHLRSLMRTALTATRPVTIADLDGYVCPGGRFSDTVAGVTDARPDGWHFTRTAADAIADRWLADAVLRAAGR